MKRDIEGRDDLYQILRDFYELLMDDENLSPFFKKFRDQQVLTQHLHDLVEFWDGALFYSGNYGKNVMDIHRKIHLTRPIGNLHVDSWINLFEAAVDSNFTGEVSDTLKNRARSIATVMKIKFSQEN